MLKDQKGFVVLINPHYRPNWEYREDNPAAVLPLGILSIGTVLSQNGYKVKIIDACTDPNYLDEVIKAAEDYPLFIGISAMTAQLPCGLMIANLIRRYDQDHRIPIVWGGVHPTIFPESTARNSSVDIVVIGLGEFACLELGNNLSLNRHAELSNIPGIAFCKNGNFIKTANREFIDINSLPLIDYELLDVRKYIYRGLGYGEESKKRSLTLYTGVGCPFRCTFCANTALHNRRYSGKTAQRILKEVDFFYKKYNIEYISFCDELFFVNKVRIKEFLDGMLERNYGINWYANIRADCFRPNFLSDELVGRMKQAGCARLGMGVESGSQRVLDEIIKKDIKLQDVIEAARLCSKHNISIGYSFMMGLPGETSSELTETIYFMNELKKIHPQCYFYGPQIYRPFPGSELYKVAVSLGFSEPKDLEGWARLETSKNMQGKLSGAYLWSGFDPAEFPWLNQVGLISYIDFMQNFIFRDLKRVKLDFKFPIKLALIFIAKLRIQTRFWRLPVEYRLYRFFVLVNETMVSSLKNNFRMLFLGEKISSE